MIRIRETLGGKKITFHYLNEQSDRRELARFVRANKALGMDTESTGVNCYKPGWQLRTFQIANATDSYVVPARHRALVGWVMSQDVNWIGHNGPHDIRSIDAWLGYETGIVCAGETFIPAHHADSRNAAEGGIGHGLKAQAERCIARDAGKWEVELKKAFKQIEIPIPGAVYKSGPRKGKQKVRKAKLSEGWSLINPTHPAYIAYAAADPLLTYRLWAHYQSTVKQNYNLYHFDKRVQEACDKLHRRGIVCDVSYTERLSRAYAKKAKAFIEEAATLGCENIESGAQVAAALEALGITLTQRTEGGSQFKTDNGILRGILAKGDNPDAERLIHCILGAKQMLKRQSSYTDAMLREMDSDNRVHPSINTLGARTTRMSVSNPPLQQLPTKDRESDAE